MSGTQSASRQIGLHVIPWLRHRAGNRVDALLVPALGTDTAAFAANVPAIRRASVILLPDLFPLKKPRSNAPAPPADSLLALYTPCPGCTCSIIRRNDSLNLALTALDAGTTVLLPPVKSGTRRGRKAPLNGNTSPGATVLRFSQGKLHAEPVVPSGHPVSWLPGPR